MTSLKVNIPTVLVVGSILVGCAADGEGSVTSTFGLSHNPSAPVDVTDVVPAEGTAAVSDVDGSAAGLASGGRPQSLDDFDDWMVAIEDWADATVEHELAACMAAKGFDYIPETSDAEEETQQWDRYVNHAGSELLRSLAESDVYLDPAQVTVPTEIPVPPGYVDALGGEFGGGSGNACRDTVHYPNIDIITVVRDKIGTAMVGSGESEASDRWAQCLTGEGFTVQADPTGYPRGAVEDYAIGLLSDHGFAVTDLLDPEGIEGVVPKDQLLQLADEVEAFEDRLGQANEACQRSSGLADQIDERIALALSEVSLDELWPG